MKNIIKAPFRFSRAIYHALIYKFAGKPFLAPASVQRFREIKCGKCPYHKNGFCQLCSCFTKLKVKLASEKCPDEPPHWRALAPKIRQD